MRARHIGERHSGAPICMRVEVAARLGVLTVKYVVDGGQIEIATAGCGGETKVRDWWRKK